MSLGTFCPSTFVQLSELCRTSLEEYALVRDSAAGVRGIRDDSRLVEEGDCFVAVRGQSIDGHDFIPIAIERGAKSVVVEHPVDVPEDVGVAVVPDARIALAKLASVHSGLRDLQRDGRLNVVGITGTNGKSTVAHLVRDLLRSTGRRTGLLSTVEYDLCGRRVAASLTTPGALELTGFLVEMAARGAACAVMEASSHALDQHRVAGVRFGVGVFTNLSGDHVDYHGSREHYLRAKKRLFDGLDARASAVVNAEDPSWTEMVADCPARIVPFAAKHNETVQISAREISPSMHDTRFVLVTPSGKAAVRTSLVGQYNVSNILAAVGVALAMEVSFEDIVDRIGNLKSVPGRLETVSGPGAPFTVLVDYAHTDDALRNVLQALRAVCPGRVIVLFGCGGDRDRSKRPRMARVAETLADEIVVTSDNPRTEDPGTILEEVLSGFSQKTLRRVHVVPDRRSAIEQAIGLAGEGDTVLLAGKGHEDYQILGTERIWFDDRIVAREVLGDRCRVDQECGADQRSAAREAGVSEVKQQRLEARG